MVEVYYITVGGDVLEQINWCKKNISPRGGFISDGAILHLHGWDTLGKWRVYDGWTDSTFYFKNSEDAALFKLRWV